MIKRINTVVALLLSVASHSAAATRLEMDPIVHHDTISNLDYQWDNYGNVWPKIDKLDGDLLTSGLSKFIPSLMTDKKTEGKAFLIKLCLGDFGKSQALKQAGFTIHSATDQEMQWKIQNGSPMPDPMTSIAGARVIFYQDGKILAIEDKGLENRLMLPGGSNDRGELNMNTACREGQEEVGLSADAKDCILVGMMNRTNANRYGANDMSFYYLAVKFTGILTPQESEVSWAGWVDLDEVLTKRGYTLSETKFLKASQVTLDVLQHVKDGMKTPQFKVLPDLRQAWKPVQDQDPKDVMHLQLFTSPHSFYASL